MCKGTVRVQGINGEMRMVSVSRTKEQMQNVKVQRLRKKILKEMPIKGPTGSVQMYFREKKLDDDSRLLSEHGIQHESVIHLTVMVHGG